MLGRVADAPALVKKHGVTQIVVAIPSATAEEIVSHLPRRASRRACPSRSCPAWPSWCPARSACGDARDLDIKDLLGRPKVETNVGAISEYIQGHTVLVTGAGGSIGSELCRQIARFGPSRLVVVDHDESSLYDLHESLQNLGFRHYVLYPASILQERKLEKIFALHRPRLVFHAAAYKHVPLMELSPDEAVLNNIRAPGSWPSMAARYGAERFVNISTDKAVEPVNVMGATKRAGELIVRMLGRAPPRHPVRVGALRQRARQPGQRHPHLQEPDRERRPAGHHPSRHDPLLHAHRGGGPTGAAGGHHAGRGGCDLEGSLNTFILEMGNPVSIVDLAQRMIDFYWKDEAHSLGVEFSGLRPGEKLDERLVYSFEEARGHQPPACQAGLRQERRSLARMAEAEHFEHWSDELIELAEEHSDAPRDHRKL